MSRKKYYHRILPILYITWFGPQRFCSLLHYYCKISGEFRSTARWANRRDFSKDEWI